jgi:hypothetical protein
MDEAGKVRGSPVITGGEAAEVFELVEATLNTVGLFVGVGALRNDDSAGTWMKLAGHLAGSVAAEPWHRICSRLGRPTVP